MFYISEIRLDSTTKEVIKLMETGFGFSVWKNFMFLVKVPNDESELIMAGIKSKEDYVAERKRVIEEEYKVSDLKFFGLDIFKDF